MNIIFQHSKMQSHFFQAMTAFFVNNYQIYHKKSAFIYDLTIKIDIFSCRMSPTVVTFHGTFYQCLPIVTLPIGCYCTFDAGEHISCIIISECKAVSFTRTVVLNRVTQTAYLPDYRGLLGNCSPCL